jgi:hypothetical protein
MVLGKELQRMFEEVGKIRETKRTLEHEIGELFALKAKFFGLKGPVPASPKKALPAPQQGAAKSSAGSPVKVRTASATKEGAKENNVTEMKNIGMRGPRPLGPYWR